MNLFSRHTFLLSTALLICCLLLPAGCTRDDKHPVPWVYVDFVINIEFTQNIELNAIGGWAYYTGGHRGILIYRVSHDEFRAFDRACPHEPYADCRIVVENPPFAECPCCNSVFNLLDGSPFTGPSRHPLRAYRTVFNFPYLQVSNY
ncbi:MAG: Rieske (2Fe-2S) protein [Bacteroidales bacterium]